MKHWGLGLLLVTTACAHLSQTSTPEDQQVHNYLDARVSEGEKALEQENFPQAETLFKKFEEQYPQNIFLERSKIGHARALAGQHRDEEALQYYRQVIDESLNTLPQFTALASYYSSASYAALGQDAESLASLKDAENKKDFLPPEIGGAELPAHLAAYYQHHGDKTRSQNYFHLAEKGIAQLRANSSTDWDPFIAKTYYMMGETNNPNLEDLTLTQIFLMRAIELNKEPWSQKSLENLQKSYQAIWNQIMDNASDRETTKQALYQLLEAIQNIRLFASPMTLPATTGKGKNLILVKMNSFIKQLQSHAQEFLATSGPLLPLTTEAQQRQTLHLPKPMHQELPKRQSLTSPKLSGEDPN